jgi:hypothetical protein
MPNNDDMTSMFDSLTSLTPYQRDVIKQRYKILMNEYRYRCWNYTILFYLLRFGVTVGSITVTSLLSLKSNMEAEAVLYWFTWALSLGVTTSNGLLTLFKIDKRYFTVNAVAERLRTETWQYLSLSGRYSGHFGGIRPTHQNQYVYYATRLEKIRMKHIDDEFVRQAGDQNEVKIAQPALYLTNHGQEEIPTPPDQASFMKTPKNLVRRKDSFTSSGSDDTVIELVGEKDGETAITMQGSRKIGTTVSTDTSAE